MARKPESKPKLTAEERRLEALIEGNIRTAAQEAIVYEYKGRLLISYPGHRIVTVHDRSGSAHSSKRALLHVAEDMSDAQDWIDGVHREAQAAAIARMGRIVQKKPKVIFPSAPTPSAPTQTRIVTARRPR